LNQPLAQITAQLTPLDAARLHSTVAYALATLEVSYLKLNGINHKTHQITADLMAVRTTMNKIQEASKMLEALAAEQKAKEQEELETQQKQQQQQSTSMEDTPAPTTSSSTPAQGAKRKRK
jgi:hypothetical protein